MNKYQEALDRMEETYYNLDNYLSAMKRFREDAETIKELVDKNTPVKVKKNIKGYSYCPRCNMVVAEKNVIKSMNYCHRCGQALDWSKSDD